MSILARKLQSAAGVLVKLYISPASGTFAGPGSFTCQIRENSYSTPVNSVQANVTYPTGKLTLNTVDTTGSPFSTTFQNTVAGGQLSLAVADLSGAVTGDQLVATLTFTPQATGNANLDFTTGSGIADAATSSNVCKLMNGAVYALT